MTSLTSKKEKKFLRFDKEFQKTMKSLDEKFWSTIEYEKDLYTINRCIKFEER